ncbi:MAG TPA: hypothetical protein DCY13_05180 [Verrucomicrobiales bacterium]|nr:hypothetical protein [Verrucomicrobiales bacterium]
MVEETTSDAVGLLGGVVGLLVTVVIYLFFCYCCKLICEKAGHQPGILIWIPIVNLIPLLTVAKLPVWMIILLLIPFVNIVVGAIMWFKICEARGKPGWLFLLLFIPIVNIAFLPYLAFSE